LFELGSLVGKPATLAAISFLAYVIGMLLSQPTAYWVGDLVRLIPGSSSSEARRTDDELQHYIKRRAEQLAELEYDSIGVDEPGRRVRDPDALNSMLITALATFGDSGAGNSSALRPRLLVAEKEVYGEYDRLAAEAAFRINVTLPILLLGLTLAASTSWWWSIAALGVSMVLFRQGTRRLVESDSVIQRSVLNGIVVHPIDVEIERIKRDGIADRDRHEIAQRARRGRTA
jgi:hypothetical protein